VSNSLNLPDVLLKFIVKGAKELKCGHYPELSYTALFIIGLIYLHSVIYLFDICCNCIDIGKHFIDLFAYNVYNSCLVVSDQFLTDIAVANAFNAPFLFWLCLPHHHHQLTVLKANQFIHTK
jgi:hypothetical protein